MSSVQRPIDRPAEDPRLLLILLGLLQTIVPLSIDMYLPALPTIAQSFRASQGDLQLTLSGFLLGFAGGQLFWGPIGDRYGRRVPMLLGTVIYILACAGCALAPDVWPMVVWRVLQAVGGSAPAVLASAMVRDLFDREEGARARSLMQLVGAIAPLAAPSIGGQLLVLTGWRGIFWLQLLAGGAALAGLATIRESLAPERRQSKGALAMVGSYGRFLTNRRFLGYALSGAGLTAGMLAYISGTPFIYIEYFHVPAQLYGLLFGVNILGIVGLAFVNRRVVRRYGPERLLRLGSGVAAISGIVLAIDGFTGAGGLAGIALPVFCFVASLGFTTANAVTCALADVPEAAGAAAAVVGTLGMGLGGLAGALVGWLADGTPWPMTAIICGLGLAGFAANTLLARGSSRPAPTKG